MGRPPRLRLCQRDTPLEPMHRLRKLVGGPLLLIKRDDCTGLALGGNKGRKLEYLLAEAIALKADVVVTSGAVQSNHVRQTAAGAARLGLECHVVLERRIASSDTEYHTSGNFLLTRLFGAAVHLVPDDMAPGTALDVLVAQLRRVGRSPYVIPPGGSNETGARGYIDCAAELTAQAAEFGHPPDLVIHATNSGGTQAGLIVGLAEQGSDARVLGVSVGRSAINQEALVCSLVDNLLNKNDIKAEAASLVRVDDRFVGPSYGQIDRQTWDAVRLVAEYEGIILDPVYTGKAMACLINLIKAGDISASSTVIFLHTGGTPGLFAYRSELDRHLNPTIN